MSEFAYAQMYSWKDPDSGQTKFSNVAPPWYKRGESVRGPRVIETVRGKVVDDTALSYEDRLLLSGKSPGYIENLRLQKNPEAGTRPGRAAEPAKTDTQAANRHSADTTLSPAAPGRRKGG